MKYEIFDIQNGSTWAFMNDPQWNETKDFFANKPTEQTVVVQIWFAKHDRM